MIDVFMDISTTPIEVAVPSLEMQQQRARRRATQYFIYARQGYKPLFFFDPAAVSSQCLTCAVLV